MDRDRLKRYLEEGLSLEKVGEIENRDPSTIGYWVKKHGLVADGQAKHASKGSVSRKALCELVAAGFTIAEIAQAVERSPAATRYWLDKYGLKTNGRRGPTPMIPRYVVEDALAKGERTIAGECRTHGFSVFVIEPSGRVRCRRCRMERVSTRRRKNKWELAQEAGGQCKRCGYDTYIGALQFHHLDRSLKKFGLANGGRTIGLDALRAEAEKCVLLCANCHAEVEAGADLEQE